MGWAELCRATRQMKRGSGKVLSISDSAGCDRSAGGSGCQNTRRTDLGRYIIRRSIPFRDEERWKDSSQRLVLAASHPTFIPRRVLRSGRSVRSCSARVSFRLAADLDQDPLAVSSARGWM